MKPKCSICNHPRLPEINLAILSGNYTLEALHEKFGPGTSSFQRHKNHLREKMVQARERFEDGQKQISLLKLNSFLDKVERGVEIAAANGDLDRLFKGAHIGGRLIYQMNNMKVPLDLESVYRLISSPGFAAQAGLLPTDAQTIIGLHQAVADCAFSPCPDPPPEVPVPSKDKRNAAPAAAVLAADPLPETRNPEPETKHTQLGTRNSELETILPPSDREPESLSLFQQLCRKLNLSAADRRPAAKKAKNNRKISEKLPAKTSSVADKSMRNQPDNLCEKNFPKNPGVGRESAAPPTFRATKIPPAAPAAPPPADSLETRNSELETKNSPPAAQNPPPDNVPRPPGLQIPSWTADELFEISHGYKRKHPPKHIPNRRQDEDFRTGTIFGDVRKVIKDVLG